LFYLLHQITRPAVAERIEGLDPEDLARCGETLDRLRATLATTAPARANVRESWLWVADMLRFAADFGLFVQAHGGFNRATLRARLETLIERCRVLWLDGHRVGGLADAMTHLERVGSRLA
ncbi:MAG: hypothetical protein AAGD38_16075, partial [Acidobacteriota bacterium]